MNTETLTRDYNEAEGYFRILNPLNDGVKLYLLKMLTDSLVSENAKKMEAKNQGYSIYLAYGKMLLIWMI